MRDDDVDMACAPDVGRARNVAGQGGRHAEAAIAAAVAAGVVGADRVVGDSRPVMTSEDFGYMLQAKPGAYVLLGNGADGVGGCSLHNPNYDFNDAILTTGADFWVTLVQSQLKTG